MITVSPTLRRQERELERLLEHGGRCDDPSLAPLLVLATSLRPAPLVPQADFRAALREQLVAAAAERPHGVPTPRRASAPPAGRRPRLRQAVAGLALTAVVAGTGSAIAASHALPGDPLYGLKRGIERTQLSLAHGDVNRGRELLEQADHRLTEAERLTAGENASSPQTRQRIATALASMDTDVRAATDLLTQAYRDSGDPEPLRILDRFLTDQRERLTDLLSLLPAPLADQARALLTLLTSLDAGTRAVLTGASAGDGLLGLVAAGMAATGSGATSGSSGGTAAAGGAGTTGGGTGTATGGAGGLVGDTAGSLTDTLNGVVGGLTGSGGTTSTGSSTPLPIPSVSIPPIIPAPTPTPTSTPGGILPTVPLPTPTLPLCIPLPPLTTC